MTAQRELAAAIRAEIERKAEEVFAREPDAQHPVVPGLVVQAFGRPAGQQEQAA